jgi:hypothetical protein
VREICREIISTITPGFTGTEKKERKTEAREGRKKGPGTEDKMKNKPKGRAKELEELRPYVNVLLLWRISFNFSPRFRAEYYSFMRPHRQQFSSYYEIIA